MIPNEQDHTWVEDPGGNAQVIGLDGQVVHLAPRVPASGNGSANAVAKTADALKHTRTECTDPVDPSELDEKLDCLQSEMTADMVTPPANAMGKASLQRLLDADGVRTIYEAWEAEQSPACEIHVLQGQTDLGPCGYFHPESLHHGKMALRAKERKLALLEAERSKGRTLRKAERDAIIKRQFPRQVEEERSEAEIFVAEERKLAAQAEWARQRAAKAESQNNKRPAQDDSSSNNKKIRSAAPPPPRAWGMRRPPPPGPDLVRDAFVGIGLTDEILRAQVLRDLIDEVKTLRSANAQLRAEAQAREDTSEKPSSDLAKEAAKSSFSKKQG